MQVKVNPEEEQENNNTLLNILDAISSQFQLLRNRLSFFQKPQEQNLLKIQDQNVISNKNTKKSQQQESQFDTGKKNPKTFKQWISENQPISDISLSSIEMTQEEQTILNYKLEKTFGQAVGHKRILIQQMIDSDLQVYYGEKGHKFHLKTCHYYKEKFESCSIRIAMFKKHSLEPCKRCF